MSQQTGAGGTASYQLIAGERRWRAARAAGLTEVPVTVRQTTPQELRELCRGHLAHFKIPRYWKIVDEYPMTVTGKVQKFKLREMAERELAAGTLPDSKVKTDRAATPTSSERETHPTQPQSG